MAMADISHNKSKRSNKEMGLLKLHSQEDSDLTFVFVPSSTIVNQDASDSMTNSTKKKKKHSEKEMKTIDVEDDSILKSRKKKLKKRKKGEIVGKIQSHSFLNNLNVNDLLSTDDSDCGHNDTRKKKLKKEKLHEAELFSEDIDVQQSSERAFHSTPLVKRKKRKVTNRKLKGDSDDEFIEVDETPIDIVKHELSVDMEAKSTVHGRKIEASDDSEIFVTKKKTKRTKVSKTSVDLSSTLSSAGNEPIKFNNIKSIKHEFLHLEPLSSKEPEIVFTRKEKSLKHMSAFIDVDSSVIKKEPKSASKPQLQNVKQEGNNVKRQKLRLHYDSEQPEDSKSEVSEDESVQNEISNFAQEHKSSVSLIDEEVGEINETFDYSSILDTNNSIGRIDVTNDYELDFEVPKLHSILNRASLPTNKQRQQIASLCLQVKHGKFNKAEDAQIKENWNYFIEKNRLEDQPEFFFTLDKKHISYMAKQNFLFYLARNMPERTPLGVYNRFKILMRNVKSGRFTEEENDIIRNALTEPKFSVTELAKRLQRSTAAVEKRVRIMKQGPIRRIKWQAKNAATFIKYLLRVTKIKEQDIDELRSREITADEWNQLSKKLDDFPSKALKRVWLENIYPCLFIPVDKFDLREVKLALVRRLCEKRETDWKTVNWKTYQDYFVGLTSAKLYTLIAQLVKNHVPKEKRNNLKKCLKVLKTIELDQLMPQIIYKMKYSDGELRKVSRDFKSE